MPVVMNLPDRGHKKSEENRPQDRSQSSTGGGLLSDLRVRIALIAAGVVLLLLGLIGWSQGWIGGAAPAPADAASSRPVGAALAPADGSDESNPIGRKRNKDVGK